MISGLCKTSQKLWLMYFWYLKFHFLPNLREKTAMFLARKPSGLGCHRCHRRPGWAGAGFPFWTRPPCCWGRVCFVPCGETFVCSSGASVFTPSALSEDGGPSASYWRFYRISRVLVLRAGLCRHWGRSALCRQREEANWSISVWSQCLCSPKWDEWRSPWSLGSLFLWLTWNHICLFKTQSLVLSLLSSVKNWFCDDLGGCSCTYCVSHGQLSEGPGNLWRSVRLNWEPSRFCWLRSGWNGILNTCVVFYWR